MDAALWSVPHGEAGAAAGVYKIASSPGDATGVAIIVTVPDERPVKRPQAPATPSFG